MDCGDVPFLHYNGLFIAMHSNLNQPNQNNLMDQLHYREE